MSKSKEEAIRVKEVRVIDDGPLTISGDVIVVDGAGTPFEATSDQPIALCRCGGSRNKPFCDGSHLSNGFLAEDRAAPT